MIQNQIFGQDFFGVSVIKSASALLSLTLSSSSVNIGTNPIGTVTLSAPAPTGGQTITLASSNTGVATVPGTLFIPGGSTTGTFTITTVVITTSNSTTISASFGGITKPANLNVNIDTLTHTWAGNVVSAGGATPGSTTLVGANNFILALRSVGGSDITPLFKAVNLVVPDSLIAATVPIIAAYGNVPWTNHNFVAGDLSVAGLVGNGTNKYLDTGLVPATAMSSVNSGGLSVYLTNANTGTTNDFASAGSGAGYQLLSDYGGSAYFDCYTNGGSGRISGASPGKGFYSGNRTGAAAQVIYFANSTTAFETIASGTGSPGTLNLLIYNQSAFAESNGGTISGYTARQFSFFAMHEGLTLAQATALYNAVQAFRVAVGGGYV